MVVSANCFSSAVQAGDQSSANQQNTAINTYLSLASSELNAEGQALTTFAADLKSANLDRSISTQDVNNFLTTLKAQGFAGLPQQEQTIINSFGLNAADDQRVVNEVLSINPNQVPLSLLSALQLEAQSLESLASIYGATSQSTPTIVSISTSGPGIINGNGDLDAGKVVTLTVDFNEKVTVTGHPVLKLNDGGIGELFPWHRYDGAPSSATR